MDKKSRQRERVKRYFIDAAKEIINSSGLAAVSARSVADQAGYSSATIYNYFADLNDLLWQVTVELIQEMADTLRPVYQPGSDPIHMLKQGYHRYVSYYLERTEIYHFLFHARIGQPSAEVEAQLQMNLIGEQQERVLRDCVAQGIVKATDAPLIAPLLVTLVHGLLSMHFTSYQQLSAPELLDALDRNIDFVLARVAQSGAVQDGEGGFGCANGF